MRDYRQLIQRLVEFELLFRHEELVMTFFVFLSEIEITLTISTSNFNRNLIMRLLKSPKEIDQTIQRLIKSYHNFDWMCAWASVDFDSHRVLAKYQSRCRRVIVGTHFFQTHPDFIETMMKNKGVRFMKQTNDLFHPKSYLFYNSQDDWQLLIGSANFTKGAFSANTELLIWVDSKDCSNSQVLRDYLSVVDDCWMKASAFDSAEFTNYKRAWLSAKSKRDSLSRDYGGILSKRQKPLDVKIQTMTWGEYEGRLLRSATNIQMRAELLEHIQMQFASYSSFRDMPDEMRKFIAGVQNKYDSKIEDGEYEPLWMAFGNMSGSGYYANRVIFNDDGIADAIDSIPLTGQVTKDDYVNFVDHFKQTFSDKSIATATRLLAMKRPDLFYCLTSANKKKFCSELGLIYTHIDLNSYWDLVVLPIQDSEWWLHPSPKNKLGKAIKNGRAAFLDSIYYGEI